MNAYCNISPFVVTRTTAYCFTFVLSVDSLIFDYFLTKKLIKDSYVLSLGCFYFFHQVSSGCILNIYT